MGDVATGNSGIETASSELDEIEGSDHGTDTTGKSPDDDWERLLTFRIEFWTTINKDGRERVYWQWCKRGAATGNRGGKRFRLYGGTYESLSNRGDAEYWQQRYWQNKGKGGKGRKDQGDAERVDTGNAG